MGYLENINTIVPKFLSRTNSIIRKLKNLTIKSFCPNLKTISLK